MCLTNNLQSMVSGHGWNINEFRSSSRPKSNANRVAGMAQLYAFGEHLRKKYVEEMKFLPPTAGERGQGHFYAHFM